MKDIIYYIVSLLVGAVLQKIQSRFCGEILYLCRNEKLVVPSGKTPSDVHILYKKRVISGLSVAKFLIINDSQNPLRLEDLTSQQGLRIETCEGYKILRADIISHSDSENSFNLEVPKGRKAIFLKFHHLNPGECLLIQIFSYR